MRRCIVEELEKVMTLEEFLVFSIAAAGDPDPDDIDPELATILVVASLACV